MSSILTATNEALFTPTVLTGIAVWVVNAITSGVGILAYRRVVTERHFAYRQHLYEQRLKFMCEDFNRFAVLQEACMDMAQAIRVLRDTSQGILKGFEEATADFLASDREIHLHEGERVLYYSSEMLNLFVRYDGFTRDFAGVC